MTAAYNLEPPNGGFRAWQAVLGSFLLQTCSYGYVNACGVFQLYYKSVMFPDKSSQQLGWITTIAVFLIFGVGIPIGSLVDRYGTRPVVVPFAALGVLSLGLLSLCKEYWQVMLCQGVAFGLACSGTTLPAVICVTQWFSTRRGLAVGMASCGSSFGGVIYPIMIARLTDSVGFHAAVKWSTLVVGIGMTVGVLTCEGPFLPNQVRKKALEEQSGTSQPAGERAQKEDVQDHETLGLENNADISTSPNPSLRRLDALKHNGVAWAAFCAGAFFCTFSLLVPFNYLPTMAVKSGINRSLSQYTLALINAGSMVGRVLPGFLSDYMGQFNIMVIVSVGSALAMLIIWLPLNYYPSNAAIIFFGIFYGFVSGGYTSLLSPCVVALVDGRVEDLGLKFGIACVCLAIGALVGIPVTGITHDKTDGFAGLIGLSGAIMALGSAFFFVARVRKGGMSLMVKV